MNAHDYFHIDKLLAISEQQIVAGGSEAMDMAKPRGVAGGPMPGWGPNPSSSWSCFPSLQRPPRCFPCAQSFVAEGDAHPRASQHLTRTGHALSEH